jgi:hypothetical protein
MAVEENDGEPEAEATYRGWPWATLDGALAPAAARAPRAQLVLRATAGRRPGAE